MKTTGLLIPTFSTRREGDLGIGDVLGMRRWVDWAAQHGIGFLQLLPINENGTDESPYSGISSIALDPIYLSFDEGEVPSLSPAEVKAARKTLGKKVLDAHLVDYPAVRDTKNTLLEISYARFRGKPDQALAVEFAEFRKRHQDWLSDYCIFKLLIEIHGAHLTWDEWPESCRTPDVALAFVANLRKDKSELIAAQLEYFAYVQWLCFRQWLALRAHADSVGVKLMGDIPIGVAFHSADVFFNRSNFLIDWFGGTPPEGYSADNPFIHEWGQNWGVPIYNWEAMAADGFTWWRTRLKRLTQIFGMFRIDHILGFYRIYGFPWHPKRNPEFLGINHEQAVELTGGPMPKWFEHPDHTDENKAANRADGDFRLRAILDAAGDAQIIAEDLGWVPEYVRPHLEELGIAGYRIPHWDSYADGSPIMGDVFPNNSFATYSTHDHDSLCATWETNRLTVQNHRQYPTEQSHWAAESATHALRLLAGFSGIHIPQDNHWPHYSESVHWCLIKSLLKANSRYAVLMVTDLFMLRDRINTPGTTGPGNWQLRLDLDTAIMDKQGSLLSNLIKLTGRHNRP
ncbi:MAG: 4-alpha-glucanotransferase [Luteolibacter sp.]